MTGEPLCRAIEDFGKNMRDVDRLLGIQADWIDDALGERYGIKVLNKSCVVLATACWEALIEDLAREAFEILLKGATSPDWVPGKVKAFSAHSLKNDQDATKIWRLAGAGWRAVLREHRKAVMQKHIGTFNTPRPENIDSLFEHLIGLRSLSSSWKWKGMSVANARRKLGRYIEDRGAIVHRVKTKGSITEAYVRKYRNFIHRLAAESVNCVIRYLGSVLGRRPSGKYEFRPIRIRPRLRVRRARPRRKETA
jgi:hypothetical protein